MQTVIQVIATGGSSLRDKIVRDRKLEDFNLVATEQKRGDRAHGWAKLHSTQGATGAINIQWHADTQLLICRVVNRRGGKPAWITGILIEYLIARHRSRIKAIQVVPQ